MLLGPTFSAAKDTEANQQHAFAGRPCSATQRLRICCANNDKALELHVKKERVHIVRQASPH